MRTRLESATGKLPVAADTTEVRSALWDLDRIIDRARYAIGQAAKLVVRNNPYGRVAVTAVQLYDIAQKFARRSDSASKGASSSSGVGAAARGAGGGGRGGDGDGSDDNGDKEKTAQDIIAESRKGGINREFPGEYNNHTLQEIEREAKSGVSAAKKALKLLRDGRFKK